jgi:V/A-type H+-transporting ATPase subunit F
VKRIVFITPPDARYGFSLTGVRQVIAAPEAMETTLTELVNDTRIGVIVIDERLSREMTPESLQQVERRWRGLIVVLPAPEEAVLAEEDYAMQLIRRAIGYQVRLRL